MATTTATMKEKEEDATSKKPFKRRSRLIVRLGSFLIVHSILFSVVCCTAGLIALILLPVLANNTYISENALLPGSANPMFSIQDVVEAKKFVRDILDTSVTEEGRRIEIPRLIEQRVVDVGAEAYYHKFIADGAQFHPLHFFSCAPSTSTMETNNSCSSFGVNSVGIIRAPRGDGKEAIVLVSPYNSENIQLSDAVSLGLAYSIFSFLSRVTWLAKDIVWLAADSQHGEYTAVSAWLKDYHTPVFFSDAGKVDFGMCSVKDIHRQWENKLFKENNPNVFKRSGTMAAALVFKVTESKERSERDRLDIYAEASNGQMPNLDLINTAHYLAVHRQGLKVVVGMVDSLLHSTCLKFVGEILQSVGKLVKILNPKWKFGITSAEFVEGTSTVARSIFNQALGVPTGPHGAFRDYQVDAITLELSPRVYLHNENAQSAFLLKSGRLIEGVLRSVNNLLEKFHQSFFLYFLTSPNKYVSVGVYMIPFALLVAPLPIVAAALFSAGKRKGDNLEDTSNEVAEAASGSDSWKWIHAAKVVFMIHLWAGVVSLLPYHISQISGMDSTARMSVWVALSVTMLLISYKIVGSPYLCSSTDGDWEILKAVTVAVASIGLCLMSIINFATAQIGSMLLVPMCLMVRPFKRRSQVALSLRFIVLAFNLAFGLLGFPPVGLMMWKGLFEGFAKVSVGDFWDQAEFLWSWNSATYPYLLWIHLACWVLCMHILMHP
ncbi:glycosylphosphatidylinositol anchor attachment 1 protein isoform X2 [Asparagus officinalis]|nr:glycosylphosphatidylinositol anchor attachment 1 protein isoform X2 [Asparagus officinalis]XP_020273152.1 glycosylphosphatidylinositol anchor attachment 1 protein isoform X2 [Asparagus officinalis]XP_020273153.1 glycosylphosphatidylinositol anchor attachment 1 protein isoform X2 [Asparagus officinalis]XP_020273154.1 glycosylphosphatidylinositol anchor attachment 1 protein isoform X2 [Asparagus officinalis]XP_020273155.1 glycosylphosphatidylinositol anchor attachment 1 protein isoform X2 [Asp